jgi:hypothetical protein
MSGASVRAQEGLAKAAQNPIADMISLPFQNNTTFNAGPKSQTQNVLNVQPVFPVGLSPAWNLITRTIMLFQPFVNYNFPDHPGRYLTFSPIITADWKAKGEQWSVPLGLGIGQIFRIGTQPVNVQAHAYYNVVTPQLGGNWTVRLQLQLLFPK